MVTVGCVVYPDPSAVTVYDITPLPDVVNPQVAIAPLPPPPIILISGATVYPAPAFVSTSSLIEKTPFRSVVIATADAFTPIDAFLDVDMNTVGVDV